MVGIGDRKTDPHTSDRGVKSQNGGVPTHAVLAAGVDWLTCTAAEPARAELLKAVGWATVYGEAEAGNDLRPWSWKGYDGITSGGASVGARMDGTIVRLSSECAAEHWMGAVQLANHVSRLDLAVTVRMESAANPAKEAYELARIHLSERRGRRVQKASHIETWSEGETAYLGSRQSARFGRLYNKGLESKEERYRDCWRWEVEYKGDTATAIAGEMAQCGDSSEPTLAYVWDTFSKWGVPPVWGKHAEVPMGTLGRTATDDDRRLIWLYTQVRPAIDRLIRRGKRAAVLDALGLTEN
jgi:hypothetical protein